MKTLNHRAARGLMYELLTGVATEDDRPAVEAHLADCAACAREYDELRKALHLLAPLTPDPAASRPEAFWQQFARSVDNRIDAAGKPAATFAAEWENLLSWLVGRQRLVMAMGASVAAIIIALLVWNPLAPPAGTAEKLADSRTPVQAAPETTSQQAPPVELASGAALEAGQVRARAANYFRKSKVLLVGLSNLKTNRRDPVDISAEQQLSRQLVHEASYLKGQSLDLRSVRLVGDLDQVMMALSNAKQNCDLPTVETIQDGIHRSNLLFKIRMVESMYDTTR